MLRGMRWRAVSGGLAAGVLVLAALGCAGGGTGGGMDMVAPPPAMDPAAARAAFRDAVLRDLQLTETQRDEVDRILRQWTGAIDQWRLSHAAEFDILRSELAIAQARGDRVTARRAASGLRALGRTRPDTTPYENEIRRLLSPSQRARFDRNLEAMRAQVRDAGRSPG